MTPALQRLGRALRRRGHDLLARRRDDRGQTTAEYALVILGAAAIATLLIAWAKGSGAIGDLFNEVVSKIL
jgi:hypothetical protein